MSQVDLASLFDFSKRSLWFSAGAILWNPLFWNCVAQNGEYLTRSSPLKSAELQTEYYNKTITKVLGGRRYLGCYMLAITIFSLGMFRDAM
jgi:phosphatidylethanolamine N-methyltransferase